MPVKTGIHQLLGGWIPACAGKTGKFHHLGWLCRHELVKGDEAVCGRKSGFHLAHIERQHVDHILRQRINRLCIGIWHVSQQAGEMDHRAES